MALIEFRKNKNGETSYRVQIRRKGETLYKTFQTKEDAQIFLWYKERLIDNMKAFDIPLKERISFFQIIDLKIKEVLAENEKQRFIAIKNLFLAFFGSDQFLHHINYEKWLEFAKYLFQKDVFRGAKTEAGRRKMSLGTLKRTFAYLSSAFSNAQFKSLDVENHPLQVIRTYITPKEKIKVN